MPKKPRSIPPEGTVHTSIRGNNKKSIFYRDCEFRYFKKLILRYKKKFGALLYHYVLMKNHIHLCIKSCEGTDISKMMQGLQIAYNHYLNQKRGYVGHLWQGRFDSQLIEDNEYLLTVALYIEKNPFEAGAVKDPLEYQWSSYRYYALGEEDMLIDVNPLYEEMGNSPEERQYNYRELMQSRMEDSVIAKM